MGWFSRRSRTDSGVSAAGSGAPATDDAAERLDPTFDGKPVAEPLTEAERARISQRLETLAARGVDVDDLSSIGAAYDAARSHELRAPSGEGADLLVDLFAVAVGEHLVRHSARQWAIVTDAFGTDLGLVAARSDTVVVPHNLVSARWMRRELGWIPGVVGHLVSLAARP
ncbi:MAG TPA: DUF3806 domain-containing protein [Intrasporangium sp.]|uniref:DUF3806 domain-containing protein n=1 Tax=Intrasporangium sp. TaxID=1925024 RepID=UPI002D79D8FA|nr:DUF3806 domain-containing protein [Intrasporangium sp.]HET7399754.1 DUF3806 domain-containing protein [Intrasporangium sp.]